MKKISKILACFALVLVVVLNVAVPCFALSSATHEEIDFNIINSPSSFTVTRNIEGRTSVTTYPMDRKYGARDVCSYTMNGEGTAIFWSAIGTRYTTFDGLSIDRPYMADSLTVRITLNALSIPEENGSNDFFSSVTSQTGLPLGTGSVNGEGNRYYNGSTSSVSGGYITGHSFSFDFDSYVYDSHYVSNEDGNCLVVSYMFYIPKGSSPGLFNDPNSAFEGSISYSYSGYDLTLKSRSCALKVTGLDNYDSEIIRTSDPRFDLKIYTVKYWYERDIATDFFDGFLKDSTVANRLSSYISLYDVSISLPYFPANAGGVGGMGNSSPILPRFYCTYSDEDYSEVSETLRYYYEETPDDGNGFLSWLVNAVSGFFNNFALGGVDVDGILYLLLIVAIVKIFLRMFAGG